MGHAPAVTGFRACAWFAFSTDGDAGLSVEFLGRGLVEQHVRRETGFGRVVGAIRFVRAVYMVVSRPGAEPSMLVLALRLRLVRRVAEWDAACVDMQCARPVFEQIVGEIPVQRLAGQADRLVRGLQLAVPALERLGSVGWFADEIVVCLESFSGTPPVSEACSPMTGSCLNVSDGWPLRTFSRSTSPSIASSRSSSVFSRDHWATEGRLGCESVSRAAQWSIRRGLQSNADAKVFRR